jgi:hypothetical protein
VIKLKEFRTLIRGNMQRMQISKMRGVKEIKSRKCKIRNEIGEIGNEKAKEIS